MALTNGCVVGWDDVVGGLGRLNIFQPMSWSAERAGIPFHITNKERKSGR